MKLNFGNIQKEHKKGKSSGRTLIAFIKGGIFNVELTLLIVVKTIGIDKNTLIKCEENFGLVNSIYQKKS